MKEILPNHLIGQVFKLNLNMQLITRKKVALPIIIKSKYGTDSYKVLLDMGRKNNVLTYEKMFLELTGKVDIEYLKYGAEVIMSPISGEPGYYKMQILSFYKLNQRDYKRVPYRRSIKIVEPVECDATLINISGSGAMIQTKEEIDSNRLTMVFTLLKKEMVLRADIIEQKYVEKVEGYYIRCKFNPVNSLNQKIIVQAVREITLKAKRRLNK